MEKWIYRTKKVSLLFSAKPEEIKAKSRLWELLKNWF